MFISEKEIEALYTGLVNIKAEAQKPKQRRNRIANLVSRQMLIIKSIQRKNKNSLNF